MAEWNVAQGTARYEDSICSVATGGKEGGHRVTERWRLQFSISQWEHCFTAWYWGTGY